MSKSLQKPCRQIMNDDSPAVECGTAVIVMCSLFDD